MTKRAHDYNEKGIQEHNSKLRAENKQKEEEKLLMEFRLIGFCQFR